MILKHQLYDFLTVEVCRKFHKNLSHRISNFRYLIKISKLTFHYDNEIKNSWQIIIWITFCSLEHVQSLFLWLSINRSLLCFHFYLFLNIFMCDMRQQQLQQVQLQQLEAASATATAASPLGVEHKTRQMRAPTPHAYKFVNRFWKLTKQTCQKKTRKNENLKQQNKKEEQTKPKPNDINKQKWFMCLREENKEQGTGKSLRRSTGLVG